MVIPKGVDPAPYKAYGSDCRPCPPPEDFLKQCSNLRKPMVRCPEGNKADRAYPIVPKLNVFPFNFQKDYWKTTNQEDFPPRPYSRRPLMKPEFKPLKIDALMEKKSVYKQEYPAHCPQPKEEVPWGKKGDYVENTATFHGFSSYKRDFETKCGRPATLMKKRAVYDANPPRMDCLSLYNRTFVNHGKIPKQLSKQQEEQKLVELPKLRCIPFDGLTTYKRDFVGEKGTPSSTFKPRNIVKTKDFVWDDRTVYRTSFEPFYFDHDGKWKDCLQPQVYDNIITGCGEDKCKKIMGDLKELDWN